MCASLRAIYGSARESALAHAHPAGDSAAHRTARVTRVRGVSTSKGSSVVTRLIGGMLIALVLALTVAHLSAAIIECKWWTIECWLLR